MSVIVREDCVTHTISLALDEGELPVVYVTVTVKSKDTDAARRLTDRLRKVVMAEVPCVAAPTPGWEGGGT